MVVLAQVVVVELDEGLDGLLHRAHLDQSHLGPTGGKGPGGRGGGGGGRRGEAVSGLSAEKLSTTVGSNAIWVPISSWKCINIYGEANALCSAALIKMDRVRLWLWI